MTAVWLGEKVFSFREMKNEVAAYGFGLDIRKVLSE